MQFKTLTERAIAVRTLYAKLEKGKYESAWSNAKVAWDLSATWGIWQARDGTKRFKKK